MWYIAKWQNRNVIHTKLKKNEIKQIGYLKQYILMNHFLKLFIFSTNNNTLEKNIWQHSNVLTFFNEHRVPLRNNRGPHSSCIYFRDPHSPRWSCTYCVGRYEPWLNSLTSRCSRYGRHSSHTCSRWHTHCLWYTRQPDHTRGRSLFRWLHLNNIYGPRSLRTTALDRTVNPMNTSPHADKRAGIEQLLERTTKKNFISFV